MTVQRDFAHRFTAASFIAAAVMLWAGWMLLPVPIGTYFEPDVFGEIHDVLQLWIWLFRLHIFGMVVTAIALMALASQLTESPARVMVWPGTAVATAGMIVGAVGAAFYYHHGAWGALEMHGKSPEQIQQFVDALRIDTEYVTCLVRFGRVFSGLGLVLIGAAFIMWKLLPTWVGGIAIAIGLAAMGLTMLLGDQMSLYIWVFHPLAAWLLATGIYIWRGGLMTERPHS